jgi:excisionase family DNA binding protein
MVKTYTTAEAAQLLGIQRHSVTQLIQRGVICAEKRGRDYFIIHEELQRFLRERRGPGRPRREDSPS